MSFNKHDLSRNACMLGGQLDDKGYDWWWHNFTGVNEKTGEERSFFIEYFLCNPVLGKEEPILGQLPENKKNGVKPSYMMVKAGAWGKNAAQLHRFFGWKSVKVNMGVPFSVKAGDCLASEKLIVGSVHVSEEDALKPEYMCDSGEMSWRLKVSKKTAFNVGYGTNKPLRDINAFEMYWHAEGMKTLFSGEVIFNGERYTVSPDTCFGYSDKNWGSDFTSPWLWLPSNDLYSTALKRKLKNSVFDIGGGCPKVLGIPLERKLLSAFYYEGKEFEFNFSKPWLKTNTKFLCKETEEEVIWRVVQTSVDGKIDCLIRCKKDEMLLVNYEAPNGKKLHNRLWNGGTGSGVIKLYSNSGSGLKLIDRIIVGHCGCEYGEYEK